MTKLEAEVFDELAAASRRSWYVRPSQPLEGTVKVAGAKNSVTKLMIAACLADGPSRLTNVPRIADARITAAMLEGLGAGVSLEDDACVVDGSTLSKFEVDVSYSALNRMPILCLPVLLHRFEKAFVPLVGGDEIGARPIDYHELVLRAMGVHVEFTPEGVFAEGAPQGALIELPYPSVGATETALLTAVRANGRTIIRNGAREPEVHELVEFLQRMGAIVEEREGREYLVEGVQTLGTASQELGGDRIEAFSYLAAGLATGGKVAVEGCQPGRLSAAVALLRRLGAKVTLDGSRVTVEPGERIKPVAVSTHPHPGIATDWQPPLVSLLTQASGVSAVHETVFEGRLGYIADLASMGASVESFSECLGSGRCRFSTGFHEHSVLIAGPSQLHGAELTMRDIRAGFGIVTAALLAHGDSLIAAVYHLERGYDDVRAKLVSLGASIDVVQS